MNNIYLIILLFSPLLLIGQINTFEGNQKDASELCNIYQGYVSGNNFVSDINAEKALNKVLSVIGASKRIALMPCNKIDNCIAITSKGIRYILFDKEFMKDISNNTNSWSNLSILAHEVGHHINGHSLDLIVYANDGASPPSLAESRQMELEADEFSGFIMYKLGASSIIEFNA